MSELILGMKSARMAADAKLQKSCIANMDMSCTMVIEMLDAIESLQAEIAELKEGNEDVCHAYSLVLDHATGGRMSKPYLDHSMVCSVIDDVQNEHVEDMIKDYAESELKQPQWVSVEERLPEDVELKLVAYQDEGEMDVFIASYGYCYDLLGWWDLKVNPFKNISHWMPLPPSPEAE